MGPINHLPCMPVLNRVEVNVIEVPRKIVFVAQRVLPIAALPNPALAFAQAAGRNRFALRQAPRKPRFDHHPADREIGIAFRHCPDGMEMIRQDNDRIDRKRTAPSRFAKCRSQQIDLLDE